jgi:hypothetical protein
LKRVLPGLPHLTIAADVGGGSVKDTDWEQLGQRWWSHVRHLADDRLEGRDTGSAGFQKAAEYVTEHFRAAGLQPAGSEGYRQSMDFRVTKIDPTRSSLELIREGRTEPAKLGEDAAIIVLSQTTTSAEADAVFVGYGLRIPEFQYDDFAGIDVRGKIAVFIRGGPANLPGPVRAHYQSLEERSESIRRAGAVGWIGIPNPKVPELPWSRLAAGVILPRMELEDPGHAVTPPPPTTIVFNPERAEKLFSGSGHTFEEMVAGLASNDPLPRFPLGVKIRTHVALTRGTARCQNVAAVLPGSDPALRNEFVVLSAHLDHLGIGEPVNGDRIYHGAMDNASGSASLLEIARWFHESGARPKRSILFLAVTGEEKGLLGSQYFATHPSVTGRLVANINLDQFLPLFPLQHLEIQGLAESTLGDDIRAIGRQRGVAIDSEYEPDRVLFIRSDQYNFIKVGVPALALSFGYVPGSPEEKVMKDWYRERYHGPADNTRQPVDLAGAAQFNSIVQQLLMRVADADGRPAWNSGSFFKRFAQ